MTKKKLTQYATIALPFVIIPLILFFILYSSKNTSKRDNLYLTHCANCHMENGEGLRALIPPLTDIQYIKQHKEELACIIRYGLKGEIVVNGQSYNGEMPANEKLSEVEITNLINYLFKEFAPEEKLVSPQEVEEALQACKKSP